MNDYSALILCLSILFGLPLIYLAGIGLIIWVATIQINRKPKNDKPQNYKHSLLFMHVIAILLVLLLGAAVYTLVTSKHITAYKALTDSDCPTVIQNCEPITKYKFKKMQLHMTTILACTCHRSA